MLIRFVQFGKSAVYKQLDRGVLAEQAYLDRPTNLKGVAVGFVLRQTAKLFCKIDREVPLLASIQGFYAYAERLCER